MVSPSRPPPSSLQEELHQTQPFPSLAVELLVSLYRTVDGLAGPQRAGLKAFDLTHAQFNVLRILAGAGPAGHRVADIGERLVNREPDVTRLVDGLEHKALVRRVRAEDDRRVVRVSITPAGRRLVQRASSAVEDMAVRQLAHLSESEQRTLVRLLARVRTPG
jgi:DNA-binding MarR family transcriptional regulator